MPILILYASDHGSTGEIAERISSRISSQLPPTEVYSIKNFNPDHLDQYTAIVLGSCVHGMAWLPEATEFLTANKAALAEKPLFAFSVGAPTAMPQIFRAKWQKVEEKKLREKAEKLLGTQLRAHTLFNGKFVKEDADKTMKIVCGLCCFCCGGMRYGDFRDWYLIEKWADEVVAALKAPVEDGA